MTRDARTEALALLSRRAGKTVCPSEVARAVVADRVPNDWRAMMPDVHAAIDRLVGDGVVQLSWKGKLLPARSGPYRIRLASRD